MKEEEMISLRDFILQVRREGSLDRTSFLQLSNASIQIKKISRTTLIQRKAGKWRRENASSAVAKERGKCGQLKGSISKRIFLVPSTEGINELCSTFFQAFALGDLVRGCSVEFSTFSQLVKHK